MIKFEGKDMPMCISWHVRGHCRSNCQRSYDHRPHSRKQNMELLSWCTHAMISRVKQPAGDVPSTIQEFRASLPANASTYDYQKGVPIPKVTREGSEQEMCINWHLRSYCSAQCKRAKDHVRHSEEETRSLHRWCVQIMCGEHGS